MPRVSLEDVIVELKHATDKAWLVNDGKVDVWIPKSRCEMEKNSDGTYTLTAKEDFLIEKGLL